MRFNVLLEKNDFKTQFINYQMSTFQSHLENRLEL